VSGSASPIVRCAEKLRLHLASRALPCREQSAAAVAFVAGYAAALGLNCELPPDNLNPQPDRKRTQ